MSSYDICKLNDQILDGGGFFIRSFCFLNFTFLGYLNRQFPN